VVVTALGANYGAVGATVPAFGDVDWAVAWGTWRAVRATH
jgi:hypothetical protein